jgi:hypothetical protein
MRGISYAHLTDVLGTFHAPGTHTKAKKLAKFRKPSFYWAFVDSERYSLQLSHCFYTRGGDRKHDALAFRHGRRLNAVHLDGHGGSYDFEPAAVDSVTYNKAANPFFRRIRPDENYELY